MNDDIWTEATWNRAYDDAMQWRDWQMCDILLEERECESWWLSQQGENG